jgi:mannose-6-phosphate isomerase-like protein (cupin superfamily)
MSDVVDVTRHRGAFFKVLQETERSQTAVMTIGPGQDAGPEETHEGDQARIRIEDREHQAGPGALVMIPARTRHHVRNVGPTPLFFVTVYAPPEY